DRSGRHLDAESLYQLAKEKDPRLNRVTVYRTLKLLKQGGLIDELDLMHFAGEQHYYETRQKQEHAHIVCLRCGKVEEFFGESLQDMRRQVEANLGFRIASARTEMGGYCADCQALPAPGAPEEQCQHPIPLLPALWSVPANVSAKGPANVPAPRSTCCPRQDNAAEPNWTRCRLPSAA